MERLLSELTERLRKTYGERLVSVLLYGSAAVGDHHAAFSDLNILCVLNDITPRELGESEPIFRWWREHGNPAPLLLSEQEVKTSTDCFAIEFHDITRRHRVLYGRGVVEGLPLDDRFYRAQLEHELRAKLLRLRQKASGILSDRALLRKLLADSLSTFCVLFRHALALHGVEGPMKKREVIAAAREHFGIDPAPFDKLLDLREGRVKAGEVDPAALFSSYLKQIALVIDAVDRLTK